MAMACLFTFTMLYNLSARSPTPVIGEHLTIEGAAAHGLDFAFPADASDIQFYKQQHPELELRIDFKVSEEGFLTWAQERGWNARPIVGSITVGPSAQIECPVPTSLVTDGYSYSTLQRGKPDTVLVVYDRVVGRAYYFFQAAPMYDEG
jgi:hypothetical protein